MQAVTGLGLLAHDVEHRVDELSALGVVTLGPVVSGTSLTEDKVVGAEDLAVGAGANRVHGSRLEVHQDGTGHVAACRQGMLLSDATGERVAGDRCSKPVLARHTSYKKGLSSSGTVLSVLGYNGDAAAAPTPPQRKRRQEARTAGGLVEVHVDALQLEVGVAMVGTGGVDTVLVAHDLPELGTDLVTALASLDVDDLTHLERGC